MNRLSRREFIEKTTKVGVGILGAGAITSLASRVKANNGPIKVGCLSDLTGAWSVQGIPLANNVKLAVDEINRAGGLLGRELELILEDTATEPRVGVEKATRLIQQHRVDVVVGTINSAMRNAVKGIVADRGQTLFLYPELYEGGECHRNIFCTGSVPPQQLEPLMPWLMEKYGPKFYFVGMDYVWPHATNKIAREIVERHGGTVVGEEYLPASANDFTAVIGRMRAAKPDVFFSTFPGTGWGTFLKQLYDFGLTGEMGIATTFVGEVALQSMPAEYANGSISALDYFMTIDTPQNKAYLERYYAAFGPDAATMTTGVGGYNAVHLWALAVKEAGTLNLADVRAALEEVEFTDSPTGPIRFVPGEHHCVRSMYIGQAENGQFNILDVFENIHPQQGCGLS